MTLIKAPKIPEVIVEVVSARYIKVKWDNVGENFFYTVEISNKDYDDGSWRRLGSTRENYYFLDELEAETEYNIRLSVSAQNFIRSDYTETGTVKTFENDIYTFTKLTDMTFSDKFIKEKFTDNNINYINFNNDTIYASLMNSEFKFSPLYADADNVKNWILKRYEYHDILGEVRPLCTNINRVMMGYIKDVLYVMERYQNTARVSNDKGQTWHLLRLTDGRIGNPVSDTVMTQNDTTTFLLGMGSVYYGRSSSSVRWSSVEHRFSTTDISFTKMDEQLSLGFDVEIFNDFADLPENFYDRAESITATNNRVYVAGLNQLRYIKLDDEEYTEDGKRRFNDEIIKITKNDRAVVKKMESSDKDLLILVTGELKKGATDPTISGNVIDSDQKGIYHYDGKTMKRVFGETKEERYFIEHRYTDISRSPTEFFISFANFKLNEVKEFSGEDGKIMSTFLFERGYISDAVIPKSSFRAKINKVDEWKMGFMTYYNEPYFTYMRRDVNRVWVNADKRIGIVDPSKEFTKVVDESGIGTPERINGEKWIDGEVYIDINDISFTDFKEYSNGMLLYKNTGEIIGYYEFPYKRIRESTVTWRPKNQLLYAKLVGQEREDVYVEDKLNRLSDPNLVPLLDKFIPKSYLDGEFGYLKSFLDTYLLYLSDNRSSNYKALLNVIRNQDPLEIDYMGFLYSELYKRNIYLDKKKKEQVIRFFESRKSDFYGAKGTEASYKFLFKLLYNEDVEIDSEYINMEYYITVESDNINDEVVGMNISTKTGKSWVTSVDRVYKDGKLLWEISINGMIGEYFDGQEFYIEGTENKGIIKTSIKGRELLHNDIDYINRGKSFYVMRIKSSLTLDTYRDDVLRFVHPYGISFKGILSMVILLRTGETMKHFESIIRKYYTNRFDSGLPTVYPNIVLQLDSSGNPIKDEITGWWRTRKHPKAGEEIVVDENEYNKEYGFTGDPNNTQYDTYEEYIKNISPYKRRTKYSPTFDMTSVFWTNFRSIMELAIDRRLLELKGNVGNPRDPKDPNFNKYEEKDV